jgi:hypothetical protein
MLFPYTYVPHQMEKMQDFIDFIFNEVWCKAPIGLVFDPDLFIGKPDLKEVMTKFGFSAQPSERGKKFYSDVKAIYANFASLSPQEIDQFQRWYQANNDIEKVCANDPATQIARYADIAISHKDLAEKLSAFFTDLYSPSLLLKLAPLKEKIGNIGDHYKTFMKTNDRGKCPFCGVNDMKGANHSKRDAYDHYLPKALYPFNSINFRNLAPACHECNSFYKLAKDPVHNSDQKRRKAFYPFATTAQAIDIQVTLQHADIENLKFADVRVQFGPAALAEEIETWKDVYGIEERYKAKLCNKSDGKAWYMEVMDEWRWHDEKAGAEGKAPDAYLRDLSRHAIKSPFSDANFLKKSFLDACQQLGLFDKKLVLHQ